MRSWSNRLVTAAVVGFIGVIVGLAVGFGYRFWATRRDELAQATIAVTLMRDEARQLIRGQQPSFACGSARALREKRTALIVQLIPADYSHLSDAIDGFEADPHGTSGEPVLAALEGLVRLFWSEHQAFILTPLAKYVRRDDLTEKAGDAVRAALGTDPTVHGRERSAHRHRRPPRA